MENIHQKLWPTQMVLEEDLFKNVDILCDIALLLKEILPDKDPIDEKLDMLRSFALRSTEVVNVCLVHWAKFFGDSFTPEKVDTARTDFANLVESNKIHQTQHSRTEPYPFFEVIGASKRREERERGRERERARERERDRERER